MTIPETALVIGGGLAGIAAALRLQDAGVQVTLLEASPRLGGRATSFTAPGTDTLIDNCQHVLLGSCTNLIALYERLGVDDLVRWDRTLYFATADGTVSPLAVRSRLPAPLHMVAPFLRHRSFSWADKATLAIGMSRIMATSFDDPAWRDLTFGAWLRRHDQDEQTIRRFWNVIITSACNLGVDDVAARHGLQVFQQGFLQHERAFELGIPRIPLVKLYDPAASQLHDVRFGQRAIEIEVVNGEVQGVVLQSRMRMQADAYVLAVASDHVSSLFDANALAMDRRLEDASRLGTSPILGVHLVFDQSITDLPHVALLEHNTDWFFFREGGRWVHAVISAAEGWMSRSTDDIVARIVADLRLVCPGARGVEPSHTHVVKSRRATFAATPATERIRPAATGPISNLYLAGDHCQSGWPATMEGAVRSGNVAAAAVLQNDRQAFVEDDLPASLIYRLLSCCAAATP